MKDYQPHELRVLEEKQELDIKIEKLSDFVSVNPIFKTLDIEVQNLRINQLDVMKRYSTILGEIISRF